ncbi:hypothetical protein D3C86_1832320 [compost metagenome]
MMSVMIKMRGQVNTPADILKDKFGTPSKLMSNCFIPSVPSTVNILTPMNSDKIALATKKDPKTSNNLLSFVLKLIAG